MFPPHTGLLNQFQNACPCIALLYCIFCFFGLSNYRRVTTICGVFNSPYRKPLPPLVSDAGSPAGSSTTNRAFHSASASFSHKRGDSGGAIPDDFASDGVSEQAADLASSNVPNGCRQAWQEQWRRSDTELVRPSSRAVAESRMGQASPADSNSRLPRDAAPTADDIGESNGGSSPLHSQAFRSSPIMNAGRPPMNPSANPDEMASLSEVSRGSAEGLSYGQESARQLSNAHSPAGAVTGTSGGTSASNGLILQLVETDYCTEEKLIQDVRGIYAGLVMAENRCEVWHKRVKNGPR